MGALLSAFATLGGAGLGAMSSSNAAAYNYQVDLMNYYQREQERQDSINQAKHQEADTKLGSTDASGNHTYFKPGVGWVTDLSDTSKGLQEGYQREEMAQLNNDLPKKRDILNSNVQRQGRENTTADALLNAFQRVRHEDPSEVEGQLNNASSKGITEGYDSALEEAMRSSVRSGASNSGAIAASIGSKRAQTLADAFRNNKLAAKGQVEDNYNGQTGQIANLYNMMASRASAMPDVAYNPRNIDGQSGQAQAQASGSQNAAAGALVNAFAKQGGSMTRIDPDYGWANAVTTGGGALGTAFDAMNADKMRQNALASMGTYAGVNPEMYQAGKGLW